MFVCRHPTNVYSIGAASEYSVKPQIIKFGVYKVYPKENSHFRT